MSEISLNIITNEPTNIIYTGVAGTGKTYQLLQIAKQYTDELPVVDNDKLLEQLLHELSWRDVVCLVFLDLKAHQQDLVKVPEVIGHKFFVAKALQNERDKNLSNTAWSVLQMHSPMSSQTVAYKNRASQAYFDKDESGAWYLLPESYALLTELTQHLIEFEQAQQNSTPLRNQNLRFSMVSFHQAYGYEEFVEGIRPVLNAPSQNNQSGQGNQIQYDIQDGAFLRLCQRAANDPNHRYAMLIDEINRANVSRVFGELLSLIEPDKRIGQPNAMVITLSYSGRAFGVPDNVDIYATINTQDHSLAPLDMAFRRRFRFFDCPPQPALLPIISVFEHSKRGAQQPSATIDLAQLLSGLNQRIITVLGQEAQLGHAFLLSIKSLAQLQTALVEQIIPQLIQAANAQISILQYLFKDEQQPLNAQFIQRRQAVYQQQDNDNRDFNNPSLFFGQNSSVENYLINPDLNAGIGHFAQSAVYQRLYL